MKNKLVHFQQLNNKMLGFGVLKQASVPPAGWVKAIRAAFGMSMQQLGNKLAVSKQAILDIEKREKNGSITLKSLNEIAQVMDMQLVYGLVPNDASLEVLVEKRATELATKIVLRTYQTMKLEDQAISKQRIKKAIKERAEEIKREMPKILWD
jgi:predicted DNA-binding mobile mystery protein A